MSGQPPPYNDGRSPSQQHRYPYSPSGRELPSYSGNDSYQHPPHTPPSFPAPPSLARSPQYGPANSPPMNTTLPPLNGSAVNSDVSPSFHGLDGARRPSYTLPRPFNNSMMAPAGSPPQPLFSPHTHTSAQDGLSHSPHREPDPSFDARGHSGRLPSLLQDRPPSPQEKVITLPLRPGISRSMPVY